MKLAFFDDRYYEVYGAQENVLMLAELAQQNGHDTVFITTSEGPLQQVAEQRCIRTRVVPAPSRLKLFEREATQGGPLGIAQTAKDLATYGPALHSVLKKENIDVVLAGAVRASLMLWRTRTARTPKVILFAQNSTPFGLFSLASLPGLDVLAPISSGSLTTFPTWSKPIWPTQMPLHSGRDLSEFAVDRTADQTGDTARSLRIVSVGALIERKGFHVLLEAIDLLQQRGHDVTLRIVGGTSGPKSEQYEVALKKTVQQRSLNVEFTGWQTDVRPHLSWANVFTLTSENEGLPGVILEAMASGLPVVATNAGGCGDVVDQSVGALVPIGNVEEIATALAALSNPERRSTCATTAVQKIQHDYSLTAFSQRFENILNSLDIPGQK